METTRKQTLFYLVLAFLSSQTACAAVVQEGSSVVLSCGNLPEAIRDVSWCKITENGTCDNVITTIAGQALKVYSPWNGSDINMTSNPSELHIISASYPRDDGTFKCLGGETEQKVNVTVVVPPQSITIQGPPQIMEDSNFALDCRSEGGVPPADIEWDLPPSVSNPEITGNKKASRVSLKASRDLRGQTVQCNAVQEGFIQTRTLTLNILYKPTVSIHTIPVRYKLRDEIRLECEVDGNPIPNTYWLLNGKPQQNSTGNNVFRIPSLKEPQAGTYVCGAQNMVGRTEEMITISLKTKNASFWYRTWVIGPVVLLGILVIAAIATVALRSRFTRKRSSKGVDNTTEANLTNEGPPPCLVVHGHYATVWFDTPSQDNPEIRRGAEPTVYASVDFNATVKPQVPKRKTRQ